MKLPAVTVCLAGIASAASPPYDFGADVNTLVRRQQPDDRITVGQLPLSADGSVPLRLEIREMRRDERMWDLFILALSMLQNVSQDDPMSWYQIAGIHGVPFETWNGVEPIEGGDQSGYCPHSSILFPMWHRPYIALFEQEIHRLANIIANMYTDEADRVLYQRAAANIRIPYWDWAAPPPDGESHFPDVFWNSSVFQRGPNGLQFVQNPLNAYQFDPPDEEAFIWAPLKYWNETKRAPDTNSSLIDPPSLNDQVNTALSGKLPEIQQRLFILFSNYKDFNSFGNKAWAVSQNTSLVDSIEAIHDIIHLDGGLKGHMTYVPLSSFDPLFLIHHTNTDRLISIWQKLNPEAWISPAPAGETSFNALKGDMQDAKTPLTPFYRAQDPGQFWTADLSRETEAFGYAYAETEVPALNRPGFRARLVRRLTDLYGNSSLIAMGKNDVASTAGASKTHRARHMWHGGLDFRSSMLNVRPEAQSPPVTAVVQEGHYTEWVANVQVNVEALDGRFNIHFFVGEPPLNPRQWCTAPNQVGTVGIFAMNRMTKSRTKIGGTLPLTSALTKLVAAGAIPHLHPAVVTPFLKEMLQFRVEGSEDEEVDPEEVEGLNVDVVSFPVTVPRGKAGAEFPSWEAPTTRLDLW